MKTTGTLLLAIAMAAFVPLGISASHAAEETGTPRAAEDADMPAADDTERNVRDRADDTLTPFDQGGSEGDRSITQQIRKTIVDDDELSTNAKNVKVITVDGVVTLRGPVKNEAERSTIASVAQKTPGVKRVDNQLEVEHDE